jgi:hypothetical protein
MNWLLGVGEILAGAAVFVAGVLLTWLFPAGGPKTMRLAILPLASLILMLLGAVIVVRSW